MQQTVKGAGRTTKSCKTGSVTDSPSRNASHTQKLDCKLTPIEHLTTRVCIIDGVVPPPLSVALAQLFVRGAVVCSVKSSERCQLFCQKIAKKSEIFVE